MLSYHSAEVTANSSSETEFILEFVGKLFIGGYIYTPYIQRVEVEAAADEQLKIKYYNYDTISEQKLICFPGLNDYTTYEPIYTHKLHISKAAETQFTIHYTYKPVKLPVYLKLREQEIQWPWTKANHIKYQKLKRYYIK